MSAVPQLPAYGFDVVQLADGARVKIRPIWLGDIAAMRRMHGRMSVGIELGRVPGAVLTGLGGVATYLAFLVIAYSD